MTPIGILTQVPALILPRHKVLCLPLHLIMALVLLLLATATYSLSRILGLNFLLCHTVHFPFAMFLCPLISQKILFLFVNLLVITHALSNLILLASLLRTSI